MQVDYFDFGAEDARNLNLRTDEERRIFLESYVHPRGFRIEDFFEGRRYFIYGPKGSGKTTLLRYIQLHAETEIHADTSYYFFQSSFSEKDLLNFNKHHNSQAKEYLIDDTPLSREKDSHLFWRLVILTEISKLLKKRKVTEGAAESFHRAIEAAKLIAKNENVGKAHPAIKEFFLRLSRDPSIEISGSFKDSTPDDLSAYLDISENSLDDVYLENNPIFLIMDELEFFRTGDQRDTIRLHAIASLVKAVRDFNERFPTSDIRVITAVRSEVVDEVSTVQGEVYRIVRDRGLAMGWHETVRVGYHPLKKIVLQRLIVQDPQLGGYSEKISDTYLKSAENKYFPNLRALDNALNLTWYRPRDISLLFEEAARIDSGQEYFQNKTLTDGVIKPLGIRLWQDAISGLAVKYTKAELDGLETLLRGWTNEFSRSALLHRLDALSHDYDGVALLSDRRWLEVLEDLYKVGAVYSIDAEGKRNFHFRGDEMPALTEEFRFGVHRSLVKALSLTQV